jgi:ActR/RegA family two-component response regulator
MFGWFGKKKTLQDFDKGLSRERLIQGGRVVVIDDEQPLLIQELRDRGFSVDHDRDGSSLHKYDNQLFDVAIVDYHGVGQKLGPGQGLDLLRYIRRVSPRTRLVAYTSRSLSAAESEFFRLSHSVLSKDLGLNDSMTQIEGELRKALAKEHLFEALVEKLNISPGSERDKMRDALEGVEQT